jgi:hypothetical protein
MKKNDSRPIHEKELGRGVGIGFGLDFRPPWGSDNLGRFGVFMDVARAVRAIGIGWRFTMPIYESEDITPDPTDAMPFIRFFDLFV